MTTKQPAAMCSFLLLLFCFNDQIIIWMHHARYFSCFLPLFTRICSPIEGIIKMFFSKWEFSNCKSFLIWGEFPIWLWFFSCNYTENVCTNLNKLDMLLFFKTKFLSMNRRKFIRTCNKEYGKIIRNWLWINER